MEMPPETVNQIRELQTTVQALSQRLQILEHTIGSIREHQSSDESQARDAQVDFGGMRDQYFRLHQDTKQLTSRLNELEHHTLRELRENLEELTKRLDEQAERLRDHDI